MVGTMKREGQSLVVESSATRTANREFLDTFLEYGIGHYYTVAKLLSDRDPDELKEAELQSVGVELVSLASAALENLVRWYVALGRWTRRGPDSLLVEALQSVTPVDEMRTEALQEVTSESPNEFCLSVGVPWRRDELRARRIDAENWLYTVDQARGNIAKALEDLVPVRQATPRVWVLQYMNRVKQGYLVGAGDSNAAPVVTSKDAEPTDDSLTAVPSDQESRAQLTMLTGNAAIGLFLLVRLVYIAVYGREPHSPAFVVIWQELYPAKGRGHGA